MGWGSGGTFLFVWEHQGSSKKGIFRELLKFIKTFGLKDFLIKNFVFRE